jgi:hypothetical protein
MWTMVAQNKHLWRFSSLPRAPGWIFDIAFFMMYLQNVLALRNFYLMGEFLTDFV